MVSWVIHLCHINRGSGRSENREDVFGGDDYRPLHTRVSSGQVMRVHEGGAFKVRLKCQGQ